MSRHEDHTQATKYARRTLADAYLRCRATGANRLESLRYARDTAAELTAVHLADSKGDDLALAWARSYAAVYEELRDSLLRAGMRRFAAVRAVL